MIDKQGEVSVLKIKFSRTVNLVGNKWKTKPKGGEPHQANKYYLMFLL